MRVLAVTINGLLDLKNFFPVGLALFSRHSIAMDVIFHRGSLNNFFTAYDAVIVGSDWNRNKEIVLEFNRSGKKSILVQSEGMFIDESQWYTGVVPVCQFLCLWGQKHEQIFNKRGYQGQCEITGPARFDIYHNFSPSHSKVQLYRELGLDDVSKPYALFLGQYFNRSEWGEDLYESQIDFTKFAGSPPSDFYSIIKCHPQETDVDYFSRAELINQKNNPNVIVLDKGSHTEKIEISTLLYHARCVVSFSSTASLEAMLLGVPSFIYKGTLSSPLEDGRVSSLPTVTSFEELLGHLSNGLDPSHLERFRDLYLPGPIDGRFAIRTADAIARYMKGEETKRGG